MKKAFWLSSLFAITSCVPQPSADVTSDVATADAAFFEIDAAAFFEADGGPIASLPLLDGDQEFIDFGNVPVQNGHSSTIALDIEDDVESVLLVSVANSGVTLLVESLIAPSSFVLVDDELDRELTPDQQNIARAFPAAFYSPARALPSNDFNAYLLPTTPDIALEEGRYFVRIGAYHREFSDGNISLTPSEDTLRVFAILKKKREVQTQATIDLSFYFSSQNELNAESAPNNVLFLEAFSVLERVMADAEIAIGRVRYRNVESEVYPTITLEEERCEGGELDALFRLKRDEDATTLPFFFVDNFECTILNGIEIGDGIAGLSGGIPGVAFFANALNSGVALALTNFEEGERMGRVMAHEAGHFLGLFHTVERVSGVVDSLSDTPESAAESRDNLMFFAAENEVLSEQQKEVLRSHPLVNEVPLED